MYRGLSDFIARLEREGELVRVQTQVSPIEEIAELTDRMSKQPHGGKALLFEQAESSFPVVTNLFGSERRMALALGVTSLDELSTRIETLLQTAMKPHESLWEQLKLLPLLTEAARWFPKHLRGRGACQQVVLNGDAARLDKLPILKCWPSDGGRFVTLPMVHTVDPDSGQRNVGMYRMQLFDAHTTGMHWHIHKTGARHYEAYRRLGRRMPVVVTLGGDPVYTYAATAPMPDNMDEYLLAGFLRHRPVQLVKCVSCDMEVPADCDFVIEGYVDPTEEKVLEGPFGDHTGFYSLEDYYPKFHVTTITHRRDAVYPATLVGIPPQEDAYIAQATERIFLAPIRLALLPEVVDLWMPQAGTAHNIAVVSIHNRYAGQVQKVAQSLWGAGQMMFNKMLVVADADTPIRNCTLLAARVRRLLPQRDLHFDEGVLDVLDHATATTGFGGKLAIDLTQCVTREEPTLVLPASFHLSEGVNKVDCRAVATWRTLLLYVERSASFSIETFVSANAMQGVVCVALFDAEAASLSLEELLWIAVANCDPRRDVSLHDDRVWIDGRSKHPGEAGAPARFPNVTTASDEMIAQVDSRWEEYGIGPRIASPSRRYKPLLLSDKAAW